MRVDVDLARLHGADHIFAVRFAFSGSFFERVFQKHRNPSAFVCGQHQAMMSESRVTEVSHFGGETIVSFVRMRGRDAAILSSGSTTAAA